MTHPDSGFSRKVLLAVSDSEDATLALRAAVDLTNKADSELHLAHAWQAAPPYSHPAIAMATDSGVCEEDARKVLFQQLDALYAAGGTAAGAHLLRGRPSTRIAVLADELGAGLIITGSRGLGTIRRLVVGSVSEGVVGLASRPVLVVRGGDRAWPPSHVIVGDDTSAGAKRTGELAGAIASVLGIQMLLLRVHHVFVDASEAGRFRETAAVSPEVSLGRHELTLNQRADALEKRFGLRPRVSVREGDAASVILKAAEESNECGGSALIAVGSRGLGVLDRLRLGSVSTKVLRAARGSVLIHPS
ncbi:universal stress protein [Rubrobacter indicoceani]|uniref:universal stress protein n=1 Tax=Rubrobacter indicoceani TaxID=2051957 RepID=UPI000E5C4B79|nr:universal stress protein [Rubrobacter indicoceani]